MYFSDLDIWFLQGKFVAEAMSVIAANSDVPVSVKCRIGVDNHDSYNELCKFSVFILFVNTSKIKHCSTGELNLFFRKPTWDKRAF